MARLFGTDGVRGIAGEELDERLATALGRAAVRELGQSILIGRDSRVSGPMLENALASGIVAEGGRALSCGVIPTPAIALLTRETDADCGIVISASHNPPEYNGIKFFDSDGFKLPDSKEDTLQEIVESVLDIALDQQSTAQPLADAAQRYINHSVSVLQKRGIDLSGIKIALDCAHGASCSTTPAALVELGADVTCINDDPAGEHINVDCGSTHLDCVAQLVRESGADIGLAHDGDADRLLAVTPDGAIVDGDFMLAICATDLKSRKQLAENTVVSTVMANLGFQLAMKREGINVVTTSVGDRYVLEEMRRLGAVIGGEQSGHIIFLEHNSTGDGLMTALQLLGVMQASGKPIDELMQVMDHFPQALVNVRVADKDLYAGNAIIQEAEQAVIEELGTEGRLLVRPSGTEPLIRVMVEARTQQQADETAQRLADVVAEQIGA